MSKDNPEIGALKSDLALLIVELAKIAALPEGQSTALQACNRHFADLPERIRDAIVYGHCAFVERKVGEQWQYLLQHGDVMVCDCVPNHLRSAIISPIIEHLTAFGNPREIIWYCVN